MRFVTKWLNRGAMAPNCHACHHMAVCQCMFAYLIARRASRLSWLSRRD